MTGFFKRLKKYITPAAGIDLNRSQYWPLQKLEKLQDKRLKRIIDYAYSTIPGYKDKFDRAGISPKDIQTRADLFKIPVTTREELQDNPSFVNRDLITGTLYTGGSTGTSLKYFESGTSGQVRWNAHCRGWSWGGFETDMKHAILKSSQDLLTENNCLHLIGDLSTQNLEKNISALLEFKPLHLKGYVNAVFVLARYCLDNGIELKGLTSVIPSSENLYPYQREVIERAFSCKVFEEYCCNDGGACGWECEKREGLHYFMERSIIEEINGEMIVTDLWNMAMPFIRYKNGDQVKFPDEKCSCGRALPLMKVKGRSNDLIITEKRVLTPTFLMHHGIGLVGADKKDQRDFKSGIRMVQYIQKPDGVLEVNMVKNSWCTAEEIDRFKNTLESFTDNLKIVIHFVEDIRKTKKLKSAFIINEDKALLNSWSAKTNPDQILEK